MTSRKKSLNGKLLATAILVLGIALALISRSYYLARHPSALEARFVDNQTVTAKFSPQDVPSVRIGLPVRISVEEVGYEGTVTSQSGESEFHLTLTTESETPPPGTACRVTVDASIAPEALKSTLPEENPPPE